MRDSFQKPSDENKMSREHAGKAAVDGNLGKAASKSDAKSKQEKSKSNILSSFPEEAQEETPARSPARPASIKAVASIEGLIDFMYQRKSSGALTIPPSVVELIGRAEVSREALVLQVEYLSKDDVLLKVPFRLLAAVEKAGNTKNNGYFRRNCLAANQIAFAGHPVLSRIDGLKEGLIDPGEGDAVTLCERVGLELRRSHGISAGLSKSDLDKLRVHCLNALALYFSMQRNWSDEVFLKVLDAELWSEARDRNTLKKGKNRKALVAETPSVVLRTVASLWHRTLGDLQQKETEDAAQLEKFKKSCEDHLKLFESLEDNCIGLEGKFKIAEIEIGRLNKLIEESNFKFGHLTAEIEQLRLRTIRTVESERLLVDEGLSALASDRSSVVVERLERVLESSKKHLLELRDRATEKERQ